MICPQFHGGARSKLANENNFIENFVMQITIIHKHIIQNKQGVMLHCIWWLVFGSFYCDYTWKKCYSYMTWKHSFK
jgi:hypothetical protein